MAIPKEPRQLMINIMYLVLTALLALNVSAEIFNAFKVVDKGLKASNSALEESNATLPAVIKKRAEKKADLKVYADRAEPARQYSQEFSAYVDGIIDKLIDEAGDRNGEVGDGDYITYKGVTELKGKKNKDVTTRLLVDDGIGAELHDKILEYRQKFIELYDEGDQARAAQEITMNIDDETWKTSLKKDKRSWEAFNFKQMPLQATLPMFHKFINDAKSSEAAVLNYLMGKVGGDDVVLDQYAVVSSPKKSYIIKGEKYETELFLSAFASANSKTGIEIAVNGAKLPLNEEGKATWSMTPNSTGIKKYSAVATITNPVTGEVTEATNTFEFEVGERSCNVAAKKMNVFYIGVDNPVSVTAAGISSNDLKVNATGGGIQMARAADGDFNVTVKQQGTATITVSGGGLSPTSFEFRTKRIPDPVAKLGKEKGGAIGNGPFRAQQGLIADLESFDFDARCRIKGFQLVRVAKRQDAQVVTNGGAAFAADAKRLVQQAKPGDRYFFTDVKAECPGDLASRNINDLVFTIR